jgi:hypothetical protein
MKIEGEYYLQGQREMASGFLLNPGGDFQFFFSYGALDRHGSGKWEQTREGVILNSTNKQGNDFTLVSSMNAPGDEIIIKMVDTNPVLLRRIYCSLEDGIDGSWSAINQDGQLNFPPQKFDHICLMLELCPERFSRIPVANDDHNEFSFRIEATVMEVYFRDFALQVGKDGLTGRHPLLDGERFNYSRQ